MSCDSSPIRCRLSQFTFLVLVLVIVVIGNSAVPAKTNSIIPKDTVDSGVVAGLTEIGSTLLSIDSIAGSMSRSVEGLKHNLKSIDSGQIALLHKADTCIAAQKKKTGYIIDFKDLLALAISILGLFAGSFVLSSGRGVGPDSALRGDRGDGPFISALQDPILWRIFWGVKIFHLTVVVLCLAGLITFLEVCFQIFDAQLGPDLYAMALECWMFTFFMTFLAVVARMVTAISHRTPPPAPQPPAPMPPAPMPPAPEPAGTGATGAADVDHRPEP